MNLDDFNAFQPIDKADMLGHINGLPDQLETAWNLGSSLTLPTMKGLRAVVIAGMGGSAIGADLLSAYAQPLCPVPVVVHRDYDLPAWAAGSNVLVIASSHSGNTEETLSAFELALTRGCQILAVSTGGRLAASAQAAGCPTWLFNHVGQPRSAVGFSFGLLLAAFVKLGLLPDAGSDIATTTEAMRTQQGQLSAQIPVSRNPAKRLAGQLVGRIVNVVGSGYLAPVSRRWKGQISEIAKTWAQFEFLPEADHNTLAGVLNPEAALSQLISIFLRSPSDHPRNRLRSDLTRRVLMTEGLNTDFYDAQGDSPLANIWTTLHFGDYLAYYLAMTYGMDPSPVAAIESLKQAMKG